MLKLIRDRNKYDNRIVFIKGSWKKKLMTKFKNLRRPARAEKACIEVSPPSHKKIRLDTSTQNKPPSASDKAEYEHHLKYLQKSYTSRKWTVTSMATILKETAIQRRQWIMETSPPVKDILATFPCLMEPKLVRKRKL